MEVIAKSIWLFQIFSLCLVTVEGQNNTTASSTSAILTTTPTSTTSTTTTTTTTATTPPNPQSTDVTTNQQPTTDRSSKKKSSQGNGAVVAGIVVAVMCCIAVVTAITLIWLWRKHHFCFRDCKKQPDMIISPPMHQHESIQTSKRYDEKNPKPSRLSSQPEVEFEQIGNIFRPARSKAVADTTQTQEETYSNIGSVHSLNIIPPEESTKHTHIRIDSQYIHTPPSDLVLDPIYTNQPHDIHPQAFRRKQSFPGDLITSELTLLRKGSGMYDYPKHNPVSVYKRKDSDVYMSPVTSTVTKRKDSDMYMSPVTSTVTKRKDSDLYMSPVASTVTNRKDSDVYVSPGAASSDVHRNLIYEMDSEYDMPPPTACASRISSTYIDMTVVNKPDLHNTTDSKLSNNVLSHLTALHDKAKKNKRGPNPSPRGYISGEEFMYLNMAQINKMARKESYPGDIELPPEYGNVRKKSVPFLDDDIYQNQRVIMEIDEESRLE